MIPVEKVDATANAQRLLDFFTHYEFVGVENARRVFAQGPSDLWIAAEGGRWRGALLAVEDRRPDGQLRGCVENCLVDPNRRREGIARALMEACEAWYRQRGLVGMEFAVRESFEPNPQLFESGYAIVREYEKDKRDWDGNLIRGQQRLVIRKDFAT